MSTHKVEISGGLEGREGDMDRHFATGQAAAGQRAPIANPSIQRQAYVQGPKLMTRQLDDDESFTGCNYYKQEIETLSDTTRNPDQTAVSVGITEVTTDDGSVYPDGTVANGVAITHGGADTTTVDLAALNGGYPVNFMVVENLTGIVDITILLNGQSTGLSVAPGETQEIRSGGLSTVDLVTTGAATGHVTVSGLVPCN